MEPAEFKQALGAYIVALRSQRQLSQERLALDAHVDRTWMGEIERGEVNPTIGTLSRVAQALGLTLGTLMMQAELSSRGQPQPPMLNPAYLNARVPLPPGLTVAQLEQALNRTLALLSQLALDPTRGDVPWQVYSRAVTSLTSKALIEIAGFLPSLDSRQGAVRSPLRPANDPTGWVQVQATQQVGKGGDQHIPYEGWLVLLAYTMAEGQPTMIQVATTLLQKDDWMVYERTARRGRTAVTTPVATERLRSHSAYLDPAYASPGLLRLTQKRS